VVETMVQDCDDIPGQVCVDSSPSLGNATCETAPTTTTTTAATTTTTEAITTTTCLPEFTLYCVGVDQYSADGSCGGTLACSDYVACGGSNTSCE
jgi:hypothetical protein